MEAYQQRVVDEQVELDTKVQSLVKFMATDAFQLVSSRQRQLLKAQYHAMSLYNDILLQRIENF